VATDRESVKNVLLTLLYEVQKAVEADQPDDESAIDDKIAPDDVENAE